MIKKRCLCCKNKKPVSEFGLNSRAKDKLMTRCKPCINKKNRAYSKTPAGIAAGNRAKAKWQKQNTKKNKAIQLVRQAVDSGKLVRTPCEKCGSTNGVVFHHDDYDKPLKVRPLCSQHHRDWHTKYGEGDNAK